jgi:hypothetical protein
MMASYLLREGDRAQFAKVRLSEGQAALLRTGPFDIRAPRIFYKSVAQVDQTPSGVGETCGRWPDGVARWLIRTGVHRQSPSQCLALAV